MKHKDILTGVALAGMTDGTDDADKLAEDKSEDVLKTVGVSKIHSFS